MLKRVLVVNRGAIAVRIFRSLKAMGIVSVAIYSEEDRDSLHVAAADEAYCLGSGPARDTYLNIPRILEIAAESQADAVHPGYGFLSENPGFVESCEAQGLVFLGPTPTQMEQFGLKHTARDLAEKACVPLLPGTGLLADETAALQAAESIGYPVMLKSTAGGGGIGMQICHEARDLSAAFESVSRLGENNFSNAGVFIEKYIEHARHIEVQVFGDGAGKVVTLGERDCSTQRRNQKVIEEAPAPNLPEETRKALHETARALAASVNYRSAGTVEFILDDKTQAFYFLEVNTRLQVEHGVTEEVYGVDIVRWMIELGGDEIRDLTAHVGELQAKGHAIQVRVYAEDPVRDFQPSAGLLTEVCFPQQSSGLRIDHWIEAGVEVSPYFDPMLAKVICHAATREAATTNLLEALAETSIYGIETNVRYLRAVLSDKVFAEGDMFTRYLNQFEFHANSFEVLAAGTLTSVQDYPGRTGYWDVGVPPSGPFDEQSFRLANKLLGNDENAAGLEMTLDGPSLRFNADTSIAITGADMSAMLDEQPLQNWHRYPVKAGQVLRFGKVTGAGVRSYLAVSGGIDCPQYLGSRSTFTLGQFGGHGGRALRVGDTLHFPAGEIAEASETVIESVPEFSNHWRLHVIYGPHGAPDFFTDEDITSFFGAEWEVHYNSSRTGVRLIGPKPGWARSDGGEAGMHPSNIHDNAYAIGTIDFTGDMPIILGPDGPSLGGFVCPATVVQADLWKLGQLKAGDKVSFVPVSMESAVAARAVQQDQLAVLAPAESQLPFTESLPASPIIRQTSDVCFRPAGDNYLLVEFGELKLDIGLRFKAHALMLWLKENSLEGLLELTPGIRSLQLHFDAQRLSLETLLNHVETGLSGLGDVEEIDVPARVVHLPLSWDDEACKLAISRYEQVVRQDAPWCPSNIEFIRRINGLDSIDEVKRIVFDASYLVMGLGDVYLGAPVATPLDPCHRLVTTKYNPARTWTAENSVGIGGSYLCIYGMEGPGGYQFVGRTLQMWNRYRETEAFDKPWLLEFFDQIRFYEVSAEELLDIRRDFPAGRYPIKVESTRFSLKEYRADLEARKAEIAAFVAKRDVAFQQELDRWVASGQINFAPEQVLEEEQDSELADNEVAVESGVSGSVWQMSVDVGDRVAPGDTLMVLESMKMEIQVCSHEQGVVKRILKPQGSTVAPGQALLVLERES